MNLRKGLSQSSEALAKWLGRLERLAILGVGNPMKGDDGIGVSIVTALEIDSEKMKVLNCLEVPENFLGMIEGFKPSGVLFIDGVDAGLQAGEVIFTEFTEDSKRLRLIFSTHGMPLDVTVSFIKATTKASVVLLGVQVSSTEFGEGLTIQVEGAKNSIVTMLSNTLRQWL